MIFIIIINTADQMRAFFSLLYSKGKKQRIGVNFNCRISLSDSEKNPYKRMLTAKQNTHTHTYQSNDSLLISKKKLYSFSQFRMK